MVNLKTAVKKTIIAKKVSVYENGILLESKDINNTLAPGEKISYSIKERGNFRFLYEYEFNGVKYSTM